MKGATPQYGKWKHLRVKETDFAEAIDTEMCNIELKTVCGQCH